MSESNMFGIYRLEQKLGQGGMGVVYRAWDTELDRPVAIKTLLTTATEDTEMLARFTREAKATSRLRHPAIVTIYHVGEQEGIRYIVMEYVEGITLKNALNGKSMPVNQLCSIAVQLADALAIAHENHVVHRDMKAENVMLGPRMEVKILDFGLAKLRAREGAAAAGDSQATMLTQVGIVLGTVSHMSPEQTLGGEVDGRSDIFSLGVILYEMSTGKMPFDGPTAQVIMARVLSHHPTPPAVLNPEIPPELNDLIQDCLRKDRELRPQAADVAERLKRIQSALSANRLTSQEIRVHDLPTAVMQAPSRSPSATGHRTPLPEMDPPAQAASAAAPVESRPPSGKTRPPSGRTTRPSARTSARLVQAKKVDPGKLFALRLAARVAFTLRWGISLALLVVPLSFLAYFVLSGGLIKAEIVEGTRIKAVIFAVVVPALEIAQKVLTFRTSYQGWDFFALAMGVVTFVLRHWIMIWVQRGERIFKDRLVEAEAATGMVRTAQSDRASTHRLEILREYAEAKKILYQERRHLAFLAIDIAGSTRMKVGEDKLSVELAFSEYKKFVERILKQNSVWKVAWTPDGIMCAFNTTEEAVKAGQDVLNGLPWFNQGVHQLRTPFSVRVGVNSGEVVFPQEKAMEEISDHIIDVAGHMQKEAAPGTLWLSREVFGELGQPSGFDPTDKVVDDLEALEWKPRAAVAAAN